MNPCPKNHDLETMSLIASYGSQEPTLAHIDRKMDLSKGNEAQQSFSNSDLVSSWVGHAEKFTFLGTKFYPKVILEDVDLQDQNSENCSYEENYETRTSTTEISKGLTIKRPLALTYDFEDTKPIKRSRHSF